jgi:hypothetical protein
MTTKPIDAEKQKKILKSIKDIKIKISRAKELEKLSKLNTQINNA